MTWSVAAAALLAALLVVVPPVAAEREASHAVAAPDGASVGRDSDADGVPSNVTIAFTNHSIDGDGRVVRERAAPLVVPIDADDADGSTPVPRASQPCPRGRTCLAVEGSDDALVVDSQLAPQRECATGRLTLCFYWIVWVHAEARQDNARNDVDLHPVTILP